MLAQPASRLDPRSRDVLEATALNHPDASRRRLRDVFPTGRAVKPTAYWSSRRSALFGNHAGLTRRGNGVETL
jgi:hypothetical protein